MLYLALDMNFRSAEFLSFLLSVITLYSLIPKKGKSLFLLFSSLFFIGYASLEHLGIFLLIRAVDFFLLKKLGQEKKNSQRNLFLILSLTLNLGVLFIFKYYNFAADGIGTLIGHPLPILDLLLPLGLSFYTFHSLSYTLDVYNESMEYEKSFVTYCNYVAFFPHIVAGPIARGHLLLPQFHKPSHSVLNNITAGTYLIIKGFFMKLVIADALGNYVDSHFTTRLGENPLLLLQAVYLYSFQVYCDFAAYTHIARGVAKCLGYDLMENFNLPYFASSMTEFWKRWHISLTSWFRDYLFYPLVLNVGRNSRLLFHGSLLLMFALSGLWHGANWTFLLWGVLHGIYLSVERVLTPTRLGAFFSERVPYWIKCLITFHFVTLASLFFRSPSVREAWKNLTHLFTLLSTPSHLLHPELLKPQIACFLLVVFLMSFEWYEDRKKLQDKFCKSGWIVKVLTVYVVILCTVLFAAPNPKTFLYIRF